MRPGSGRPVSRAPTEKFRFEGWRRGRSEPSEQPGKSSEPPTPPNQMPAGVLGVGFLGVSACRFALVCMAQSIISCIRIYRRSGCNSKGRLQLERAVLHTFLRMPIILAPRRVPRRSLRWPAARPFGSHDDPFLCSSKDASPFQLQWRGGTGNALKDRLYRSWLLCRRPQASRRQARTASLTPRAVGPRSCPVGSSEDVAAQHVRIQFRRSNAVTLITPKPASSTGNAGPRGISCRIAAKGPANRTLAGFYGRNNLRCARTSSAMNSEQNRTRARSRMSA